MKNGWYYSTTGLIHWIKKNRYICNSAIGYPDRATPVKNNGCKNCRCQNCVRKLYKNKIGEHKCLV